MDLWSSEVFQEVKSNADGSRTYVCGRDEVFTKIQRDDIEMILASLLESNIRYICASGKDSERAVIIVLFCQQHSFPRHANSLL